MTSLFERHANCRPSKARPFVSRSLNGLRILYLGTHPGLCKRFGLNIFQKYPAVDYYCTFMFLCSQNVLLIFISTLLWWINSRVRALLGTAEWPLYLILFGSRLLGGCVSGDLR